MLKVKLLMPGAKPPSIGHPGEDLGYDVYAAQPVTIPARGHAIVSTGIAIECTSASGEKMGALLRSHREPGWHLPGLRDCATFC